MKARFYSSPSCPILRTTWDEDRPSCPTYLRLISSSIQFQLGPKSTNLYRYYIYRYYIYRYYRRYNYYKTDKKSSFKSVKVLVDINFIIVIFVTSARYNPVGIMNLPGIRSQLCGVILDSVNQEANC